MSGGIDPLLADRLYFYLRGLTGDAHLAEDLLQDLHVKLLEARSRSTPADPRAEAFCFKAARNAAFNAIDRMQRRRRAGEGWQRWKLALQPASLEPSAREEFEALGRALAHLEESERELVLLKTHADLSFAQLAELLNVPRATLCDRYAQALRKLRALLDAPAARTLSPALQENRE